MPLEILLIDDSDADHHLFKSVVKNKHPSCNIESAFDGNEAISVLNNRNKPFDIIFLDVNMPVMDGYGFMEAYGDTLSEQKVPVYILTSVKPKGECQLFSPYPSVVGMCLKSADFSKVLNVLEQFE